MNWKIRICGTQNGNKMVLEGLDGCRITDIYPSRDKGFFTNGYHLVYGVTSLFVYNVTDMLSDEEKLCARITNLSSIEAEVILGTLIANILN